MKVLVIYPSIFYYNSLTTEYTDYLLRSLRVILLFYMFTNSVHSLSAVSSLLMVWELISIMAAAVGETSPISDKAATALATTYNKS